jgi:hypothetical protein
MTPELKKASRSDILLVIRKVDTEATAAITAITTSCLNAFLIVPPSKKPSDSILSEGQW